MTGQLASTARRPMRILQVVYRNCQDLLQIRIDQLAFLLKVWSLCVSVIARSLVTLDSVC